MLTSAGRVLFGVAMVGFGLEQAVLGTLRDGMPTPPFWMPHSLVLGYLSAAVLLLEFFDAPALICVDVVEQGRAPIE